MKKIGELVFAGGPTQKSREIFVILTVPAVFRIRPRIMRIRIQLCWGSGSSYVGDPDPWLKARNICSEIVIFYFKL